MSLNWKEIDLILSEWSITKGKIQQVLQPSHPTLFLEIYTPQSDTHNTIQQVQYLHICLSHNQVRLHSTLHKAKKPKKPQRFQQLLQSRIIGKYITHIEHIHQDRIVRFTLTNPQHPDPILYLYIKLWNNQANVILTDTDNMIIDLIFRRPKQALIPKSIFTLPEKNDKYAEPSIRPWDSSISFNKYIAQWYGNKSQEEYFNKEFSRISHAFNKQSNLLEKKQQSLSKQQMRIEKQDTYTHYGTLILNNLHNIDTSMTSLSVSSFNQDTNTTEELVIPIDSSKSPIENAEHYFQLSKKLKQTQQSLHIQYKQLSQESIIQQEIQKKLAQNDIQLNEKQSNWLFPNIPHNKQNTNTNTKNKKPPIKLILTDGIYTIMIGRNSKENDILLRHYVKGNDMWFHIRGQKGAYVFIRASNNKTLPLDMLKKGAQLASLYSKVPPQSHIDVHYTQVKYLKRIKESRGMVSPLRDNNLHIQYDIETTKQYLTQLTIR